MLFKIVWKNFKGNIRNFLAFFVSAIVSISALHIFLYLREFGETIPVQSFYEWNTVSDLVQVANVLIPVMILLSAVVTVYALRFYIRSRLKEYALFTMLGIRKKDMRKLLVTEYAMACTFACLCGIACGRILSVCIGMLINHVIGGGADLTVDMLSLYKWSLFVCLALIGSTLFGVSIVLSEKDISDLVKNDVVKEAAFDSPKSLWCFLIGVGINIMTVALIVKWEGDVGEIENMIFLLLGIGIFVLINFGVGYFWRNRRRKRTYYDSLLEKNQFHHRVRTNCFAISVQTILGVILLVFSFQIFASIFGKKSDYPYDFLCLYDSEENFAEKFAEKYRGEQKAFPVVWISSQYTMPMLGISVSDYNAAYGQKEVLEEDEIIALFSSNNWTLIEDENTGKSTGIFYRKTTFSKDCPRKRFRVKREEENNLLGFTLDGAGVVLLSDEEFKRAREEDKYKQSVALLNVDRKELDSATAFVQGEKGLEKAYCRTVELEKEKIEIAFGLVIIAILDATLLFFALFIMWLKVYGELERLEQKYEFLDAMGMKQKICRKTLEKEISLPFKIQLIWTACLTALYCGAQVASQKLHGMEVISLAFYIKELTVILAVYIFMEVLFVLLVQRWGVKNICRRKTS